MSVQESIAARAAVVVRIKSNEFYRGLSEAEKELTNWGQRVARAGMAAMAGGAIGLALLKKPIQDFARIEQLSGRFDRVFGTLKDQAKSFAKTLAVNVNNSVYTVMDSMAQFQAMLRGAGFDPEQAFQLSKWAAQAAQDIVAFDDTLQSTQEGIDKVMSGLMGEYRPVIGYGADVRVENLKRSAREYGIAVKGVMSLQDQLIVRIGVLNKAFERSGITGQAVAEVNTLASLLRGLAAAYEVLSVSIGRAVGGRAAMVTTWFMSMAHAASIWIDQNPGLVQAFSTIAVVALAAGTALFAIGGAAILLGSAFGALKVGLIAAPWYALRIGAISAYQIIRTGILRVLPVLWRWFGAGAGVLRSVVLYLSGVTQAFWALGAATKAALVSFVGAFSVAFRYVYALLKEGSVQEAMKQLAKLTGAYIGVMVAELKYWWVSFTGLFAGFGARFQQVIATISNTLRGWWNRLLILLDATGMLQPIIDAWNWLVGITNMTWAQIVSATQRAWAWIVELTRDPIAMIKAMVRAYAEETVKMWTHIYQTAVSVFSALGAFLYSIWQTIVNTATQWWDILAAYVVERFNYIVESISQIMQTIFPYLKQIFGTIYDYVANAVDYVVDYWSERWGWLMDYLSQVFQPWIDSIRAGWNVVKNIFLDYMDIIGDAWNRLMSQSLTESLLDFQEVAGQTFLWLWSLFDKTLDYEGAIGELSNTYEQKREEARRRLAEEEERRVAEQNAINAQADARVAAAQEEARKRKEAADANRKDARRRLEEIKNIQKQNLKVIENRQAQKAEEQQPKLPNQIPGLDGQGQVQVSTGFVNSAIQKALGIGEESAMDDIAASSRDTAKHTADINKKIDRLGLQAGN